jgi:hypothetical protein
MTDLASLYRRPSGTASSQKALPIELYPAIVKKYDLVEINRPKMSSLPIPALHLEFGLTDWPTSIPASERTETNMDGKEVPIDLSTRTLRTDMPTPSPDNVENWSGSVRPDTFWYFLDRFLQSCGIELGPDYETLFPQLLGCRVNVEVQQYMNQRTGELGNQVGRVFGTVNNC